MSGFRGHRFAGAGLLALCLSAGAHAQVGTAAAESEFDLVLRAGLNHTDNLGRAEDGDSATFGSLGTTVDWLRASPRLFATLNGELDYLRYDEEDFSDEVLGRVNAYLGVSLVPQRIDWVFENRFGQAQRDIFAPDSPGNRENLNVFETGPDLYLPLGRRTVGTAQLRYSDRRFQRSDRLDSDVRSATLGLRRLISPTQSVGLNAAVRRIEFDGDELLPISAYEVQSAFLSYERELATGSVSAAAGANRLKRAGSSEDGLLLRLNWSRELTARSRLTFDFSREFQDAGDQFRRGRLDDLAFTDAGRLGATADPFTGTVMAVAWTLGRDRMTLGLGASHERDRYETDIQFDRDATRLTGNLGYRFSDRAGVSLRARVSREDYQARPDGDVDDLLLGVSLDRRLGRQWELSIAYTYTERSADFGRTFEENRFTLGLSWFPLRR